MNNVAFAVNNYFKVTAAQQRLRSNMFGGIDNSKSKIFTFCDWKPSSVIEAHAEATRYASGLDEASTVCIYRMSPHIFDGPWRYLHGVGIQTPERKPGESLDGLEDRRMSSARQAWSDYADVVTRARVAMAKAMALAVTS